MGADLVTCGVHVACDLGCSAVGAARCKTFDPTGVITAQDLLVPDLVDLVLAGTTGDLASGAIADVDENQLRAPNDAPATPEIKNGVRFWTDGTVAVVQAKNITFNGANPAWTHDEIPLVLIATEEIHVYAPVSFRCHTLGGGAGGTGHANGGGVLPGPGATQDGSLLYVGGAAGGTHGTQGGTGGAGYVSNGINGAVPPQPSVDFLFHGGGGGGGGYPNGKRGTGLGGSGGAAVQLIAGTAIRIGDGTALPEGALQGLSAGGCGGTGSAVASGSIGAHRAPGAGGGAGGFLLLESPLVTGAASAGIAVNGGGGAGGSVAGKSGTLSAIPAAGGTGSLCGRAGGAGGAGSTPAVSGTSQFGADADNCSTEGVGGGGGGGAIGRIVVNTLQIADGIKVDGAAAVPFVASPTVYRRGLVSAEQ